MRNFDVGKLLEDHEPSKVPEKKLPKFVTLFLWGFTVHRVDRVLAFHDFDK